MAEKDEFIGETFESKDWRDANRRIFVYGKGEKVNRKGQTVVAYLCRPAGYRGTDGKHTTKITPANLKKRWRKVSH